MANLGVWGSDPGRDPVAGWAGPTGQRARRAPSPQLQPPEAERGERLRHVQQMLLAATLASGTIIAVAAVMMFRFL